MTERLPDLKPVEEPRAPTWDGELTDDELEAVVGGLTRPWIDPLLPPRITPDPL